VSYDTKKAYRHLRAPRSTLSLLDAFLSFLAYIMYHTGLWFHRYTMLFVIGGGGILSRFAGYRLTYLVRIEDFGYFTGWSCWFFNLGGQDV
jgi:hypothetical protein